MYYILNQTDHIIAADEHLLEALSVSSLDDLHKEIALGHIELISPFGTELHISIQGQSKVYQSERHILSSLLGDMTLVEIQEEAQKREKRHEEETEIPDSELFSLKEVIETEEDTLLETDTAQAQPVETAEALFTAIEEEAPLALISDDIAEDVLKETAPVVIDIQNISQMIGISTEDYDRFLKEYIDTALTLEEDLKSHKETLRSQAIDTLSHLSQVLHLSSVTAIIETIQKADENTRGEHIDALYSTLSRVVTTEEAAPEEHTLVPEADNTPAERESFGSIDLSTVKPIHFDFQLSAAAEDLSLPIELIEEFVIDFIDQAHIETDRMLEAYQKGDLGSIQKIGHLLKGTSSNLRIKTLADTLYAIQFCEDSTQLEDLIKTYWGHFLSFENQISITLKRI